MIKTTISLRKFINYAAAVYILCFVFVPPLQVGSRYRLLAFAMCIIWFFSADGFGKGSISKRQVGYLQLCGSCAALMIFTSSFMFGLSTAIIRNLQFIIICIVGYISLHYFERDRSFFDKWILFALVLIFIFCVTTLQGLAENPYASRIANSEWLEDRFEGNENVGLYGYVYMCILIFPILLYMLLEKLYINRIFALMYVLDCVIIFLMTLSAGYMVGICCFLIGLLMVLFLRKITPARCVLIVICSLLFLIFYRPIVNAFFEFAFQLFGDSLVYKDKILNFQDLFLNGTTTGETVAGRTSNYGASIREIVQYPIFGSYLSGVTLGGGHSTVFDTIGKMGWGVAILYFTFMWKYPFSIYKTAQKGFHVIKATVLINLIIFGVFDPYAQEIGLVTMVWLPYCLYNEERIKGYRAH